MKRLPDVTIHLDKNNEPLPRDWHHPPARKVAVQLTHREHFLEDSSGNVAWALKPETRREIDCVARLGYEVVVVHFLDIESRIDFSVNQKERNRQDYAALSSDIWKRIRLLPI